MPITYQTDGVLLPDFNKTDTNIWIKHIAFLHGKKVSDISYMFCSDDKILEINRQYLKHDYYTDIITFDYSEGNNISGDIYISVDTVRSNSEKFKTFFSDELHRVIIHGILHLCGFNDQSPEDKEVMRKLENEALSDYVKK